MLDMHVLGATDLYTAGLGAEIAGAVLLAKGLLVSPVQLYARSRGAIEFNASLTIGMCEDRVDATFGVAGICLGFAIQLAGYVTSLVSTPVAHGEAAGIAAAFVLPAAALVGIPWWVLRGRLVRREIVRVGFEAVPTFNGISTATFLAAVAQRLGYGRTATQGLLEPDHLFAGRVFGIELEPSDPKDALIGLSGGYPG